MFKITTSWNLFHWRKMEGKRMEGKKDHQEHKIYKSLANEKIMYEQKEKQGTGSGLSIASSRQGKVLVCPETRSSFYRRFHQSNAWKMSPIWPPRNSPTHPVHTSSEMRNATFVCFFMAGEKRNKFAYRNMDRGLLQVDGKFTQLSTQKSFESSQQSSFSIFRLGCLLIEDEISF